ncbi:class I SAM-dependent methyltransferase [Streptomyces oceani]|uniref:class I SAM-dependent methyltransferase n=1 Tax=Streptomyces oceani TaxID=1075402 RepID=UPI000872BD94|nr:class I SAM-dependent methyltransferase [Streptomyces oceani]
MLSAKRAISRAAYGSRFDKVPETQLPYVRPGERLARELQWRSRLQSFPVMSMEEYQARAKLGPIEEFVSCHMCGETRQQPIVRPRSKKKKDGKWAWSYRVVHCPSCGFLYRNPNILPERLGDLYAKNYSSFLTGDYAEKRQRRYRLTMDSFSPVFTEGNKRRLLDFGCGAGYFLELAEERGFDACGVDLSPDSVEQANQRLSSATAYHGAPEDIPEISAGGFDVVTLWSVLAHLPRPIEDFTTFRNLLGPGGVLLLLSVNANSLLLKRDGAGWNGFTKNHLMFYSADTLPMLLRHAGFAGVAFEPFYGDTIEAGTTKLPEAYNHRLRKTVDASDGGNMLRALAFADQKAIDNWGDGRTVHRL